MSYSARTWFLWSPGGSHLKIAEMLYGSSRHSFVHHSLIGGRWSRGDKQWMHVRSYSTCDFPTRQRTRNSSARPAFLDRTLGLENTVTTDLIASMTKSCMLQASKRLRGSIPSKVRGWVQPWRVVFRQSRTCMCSSCGFA